MKGRRSIFVLISSRRQNTTCERWKITKPVIVNVLHSKEYTKVKEEAGDRCLRWLIGFMFSEYNTAVSNVTTIIKRIDSLIWMQDVKVNT